MSLARAQRIRWEKRLLSRIRKTFTYKIEKEVKQMKLNELATSGSLSNKLGLVTDLEMLPVNIEIEEANGEDKDGKEYTYHFVTLNGQKYRIPNSVITQIGVILSVMPKIQNVNVSKTGTGLNTRYQVIAA